MICTCFCTKWNIGNEKLQPLIFMHNIHYKRKKVTKHSGIQSLLNVLKNQCENDVFHKSHIMHSFCFNHIIHTTSNPSKIISS